MKITLNDVERAWISKDPVLADLIIRMADQTDPKPEKPFKGRGIRTYGDLVRRALRPAEDLPYDADSSERMRVRREAWAALEAPDAEYPLPDRFRLFIVLLELWKENGLFERDCLFRIIDEIYIKWGPWRAFKRIFKEAEARNDTEMLGALNARLDGGGRYRVDTGEVKSWTIMYLRRRAWRYLRRTAAALPAVYVDAAVDFLRFYSDEFSGNPVWTGKHILVHKKGAYDHASIWTTISAENFLKHRAYSELWQRTPRPLFTLLERARSESIRECAVAALKSDFPVALREARPDWVTRLVAVGSETVDEFVVWLLTNVPRFAQDKFRELELHESVLRLLDSPAKSARAFAAEYARVYARDIKLDRLLILINHEDKGVRALAGDLLESRDPRTEVGLEAWSSLIGSLYGDEPARAAILKHFGAAELTPAWFRERLLGRESFRFASEKLFEIHPRESLSAAYFYELLDDPRLLRKAARFAFEQTLKYASADAPMETRIARGFLLLEHTREQVMEALENNTLDARTLGADFLKALAYRPLWDENDFIRDFREKERSLRPDGKTAPDFDEQLSETALEWLGDFRKFKSADVGLDWLLELVSRSEPRYHEWAADYMVRGMEPNTFASEGRSGPEMLWEMLTAPGKDDDPARAFALRYFRERDLDMAASGGGAAGHDVKMDPAFMDYAKGRELMLHERPNLRSLGLDYARRRMAAWKLSVDHVLELCETTYSAVRDFTAQAVLADDVPETRAYRIDPEQWTADDVYRFCESLRDFTRNLGMRIIARVPKFARPDELFRLTESPDRRIRFFVIRTIWDLYRDRGVSLAWTPPPAAEPEKSKSKDKSESKNEEKTGTEGDADIGAETGIGMAGQSIAARRGDSPPTGRDNLKNFLRRVLFEIPPARFSSGSGPRVRVLPARKAKLYMIEVLRELSVEYQGFARLTVPLLDEFMHSRGKSEHAACLVALTRIHETHPGLEAKT